jgi:hypothetical protein
MDQLSAMLIQAVWYRDAVAYRAWAENTSAT